MKLMKKLAALILVVALVMALGITASAASTVNITINNAVGGATYNAYRLLETTTSLKNNSCHTNPADHLSTCYNIAYAVNDKYFQILKVVTGETTEELIIEYIKKQESAEQIRNFANSVYSKISESTGVDHPSVTVAAGATTAVFSNIASGYWLISEKITATDYNGAYSLVMLDTIGSRDITISTKRDEPALEKFVRDNGMNYGQGADLGIGDDAEFLLRTDVPNPIGYTMYKYVIHDVMSEALTLNASSLEIRVNGVEGELLDGTYYTVDTAPSCASGCKFHVGVDIPAATAAGKIQGDSRLYISYTAKLNEHAKVMINGTDTINANPNKAWLEYSNNPYNTDMTATSTPKTVYVWTFPLEVKKVDEANMPLSGAKFVVSKMHNLPESDLKDANTDGKPDGYSNLIPLIDKGSNTYMVAPAGYTGAVVYEFPAGTANLQGFDDQVDYYLYETVAPDGYNKLNAPISFKFFASYVSSESPLMAAGYPKVSIDAGVETSSMSASIVNKTGAELPSTGGIGTTIFYVLGSVMVLGAVVLLITKKRMGAEV